MLLLLGGCGIRPAPVRLAGPLDSIAPAPRPAASPGGCDWPALDNPKVAALLMDGTLGGRPVSASLYECRAGRV